MYMRVLTVRMSFARGGYNIFDTVNITACPGLQAGGGVQAPCIGTRGVDAHDCALPNVASTRNALRSHQLSRCKVWHWFTLSVILSGNIDSTCGIAICSVPI